MPPNFKEQVLSHCFLFCGRSDLQTQLERHWKLSRETQRRLKQQNGTWRGYFDSWTVVAKMGKSTSVRFPGRRLSRGAVTSDTGTKVLLMQYEHGGRSRNTWEGLQKTVGHTGEQSQLMFQVYCWLQPVQGAMLITPRCSLKRGVPNDEKHATGGTQASRM